MKLRGIIELVLGNFICLRGYATMKELYSISSADENYQRDSIDKHHGEMADFLRRQRYLFFPEVVLGTCLEGNDTSESLGMALVDSLYGGEKVKEEYENFKLTTFIHNDNREQKRVTRGEITLDITSVQQKKDDGNLLFHRIDGNHRLSAAEFAVDGEFDNLKVPFSLIILPNESRLNELSKVIFHNINYKQIPLSKEQNLKLILEDEESFSDEILLENPFGWEYYLSRKIKEKLNYNYIPHLKSAIEKDTRTFLVETFKYLIDKDKLLEEDDTVNGFSKLLSSVNSLFSGTKLAITTNGGLLGAFLYYQQTSPQKVQLFKKWVLKNHIYELTEVDIDGFVKIFDKIAESKKKEIFISMQFSDETKQNYEAIKNAVEEVNRICKEDISIHEIRIDQFNTGFSYDINDEILSLIENCGLLIADLTKGNKNVYHEIGYLMGLNQGKGLSHENFILIHNSGIGKSQDDIGFNLVSIKQLRVSDSNALRQDLIEQIKIYYGLE